MNQKDVVPVKWHWYIGPFGMFKHRERPMNSKGSTPVAIPLFKEYPQLAEHLPHVPLGAFPTPVENAVRLSDVLGLRRLFIKRDDLSGRVYGGNKVRKLEFLLGDALSREAREVVTVGFAGSNHALATAIYAGQAGLASVSMLMPQSNAHYVRRNLLASHACRAELHYFRNLPHLSLGMIGRNLRGMTRHAQMPRYIPAGGSCPLGVVGYVNAAFELRDQIQAGVLPEPDVIYVALGSMGTAAGLALGLQAAGVRSRVIAVRVIETHWAPPRQLFRLLRQTDALLRKFAPTFPRRDAAQTNLVLRDDCMGEGYARFTAEGVRAAELLQTHASLPLNGAYSAKAFAALLADARQPGFADQNVLFWNTYNSRDLSAVLSGVDYHQLPTAFHRYFEEDVQPLDRNGAADC